jgi:hypothetical protein
MPAQPKKFNAVRATRLSLLLTLSLTVGIGTTLYAPLAHYRATLSGARRAAVAAPVLSALSGPMNAAAQATIPQEPARRATSPSTVTVVDSALTKQNPVATREEASRPSDRAAPEQGVPAPRNDSEDGEGSTESGRVPSVRLVRVVQRAPGSTVRAAPLRPSRQVTPAVAGQRPVQAAAPVARPAVPRIVRRPTVPVIATTAAS